MKRHKGQQETYEKSLPGILHCRLLAAMATVIVHGYDLDVPVEKLNVPSFGPSRQEQLNWQRSDFLPERIWEK